MADRTGIAWTDATWNPVRGCTRVSEGCRHCYAEKVAARFSGPGQAYEGFADRSRTGSKWTGRVELIPAMLDQPLRWRRPRRIFVNSMSDLFHESLPDDALDLVFAVMALAPQHTFQVLTKRADRMRAYMRTTERKRRIAARVMCVSNMLASAGRPRIKLDHFSACFAGYGPFPNVWLGVSVENQSAANERIPELLATPAAIRFLSCEPLLGPVDLTRIGTPQHWGSVLEPQEIAGGTGQAVGFVPAIDWVIAGGESGPGARPMRREWAEGLRGQCGGEGISFFFKQVGSNRGYPGVHGQWNDWPAVTGKGTDPAEWPANLRVQEFPNV